MDSPLFKAAFAGIFFGLWPLFMNRSGLPGNVSGLAFSTLATLFIFPFAWGQFKDVHETNWTMVLIAGALSAAGVMAFNGMLAKAGPKEVGTYFAVMIVFQTAIPAIYHWLMNGKISAEQMLGFALITLGGFFLLRGQR